ncbi:MAG: gluconate 2-dehydrogenase subunit 3 family protein [Nitrospiraceae bacterium]|nr:MAG: gluconate 2-dehydrogenase subunit 3 family protein [Nitrospiraceae bacterium]
MSRKFTRRQFIKISAFGIAAAAVVGAVGKIIYRNSNKDLPNPFPLTTDKKPVISSLDPRPLFFNDHQYNLVAALAALIVPTDDDPGAAEAGVAAYIDRMVAGSEEKKKKYIIGLGGIDNASRKQYGKDYLNLTAREQMEILIAIDEMTRPVSSLPDRVKRKIKLLWNDLSGKVDNSEFFKIIRADVFLGYYSNPIIWKMLGYYGPPQPVGYMDYFETPSSNNYMDTIRPLSNKVCQNCHFDQLEKNDHKEHVNCMGCHEPHFPLKGVSENG